MLYWINLVDWWYELLHDDDEYPDEENDDESEEGERGGVVDEKADEHDKNPEDVLVALDVCSILIFLLLVCWHLDSTDSILTDDWGLACSYDMP